MSVALIAKGPRLVSIGSFRVLRNYLSQYDEAYIVPVIKYWPILSQNKEEYDKRYDELAVQQNKPVILYAVSGEPIAVTFNPEIAQLFGKNAVVATTKEKNNEKQN